MTSAALRRRLVPALAAALALGLLVSAPAIATGRKALPDPCAAVTTGAVNVAFGATSDTPEFGTPGTKSVHGVAVKTCSWTYSSGQLVVSVAAKTFKPAAWPAGTVTTKAAGLGATAKLSSNKRFGSKFIAVTFTKGGHWGEVWVVGGTGSASVLKLGRQLYAKL
jgi:hypothetical protein